MSHSPGGIPLPEGAAASTPPPREKQVKTAWGSLLDDAHDVQCTQGLPPLPPPPAALPVDGIFAPVASMLRGLAGASSSPPPPRPALAAKDYDAFVLAGLFSDDECRRLIAASEEADCGYGTTNYPKKYRGNLRLITEDESLTARVWERLRPFAPPTVELDGAVWDAVGLNECWRLAKYFPGDQFLSHCDAPFTRSAGEMSMYTVNAYMNGGFEGGSTRFYDGGASTKVLASECVPVAGSCVVFRQPPGEAYLHDGEQLRSGEKFLFRSDIMYRKRVTKRTRPAAGAAAGAGGGAAGELSPGELSLNTLQQ
jgi:hypothetical protein